MRYFRACQAVYEQCSEALDAAYGYPSAETKTLRALPPADTLPSDADGLLYLAVSSEYASYDIPRQMLQQLIADGRVEEITEADYMAAVSVIP